LAAVADDGDALGFDQTVIGVAIVENAHYRTSFSACVSSRPG
jgi:hypothetical protein